MFTKIITTSRKITYFRIGNVADNVFRFRFAIDYNQTTTNQNLIENMNELLSVYH